MRVLGRFRVSGVGFRVSGFGFRVSGFGFRVSGFGFRAHWTETSETRQLKMWSLTTKPRLGSGIGVWGFGGLGFGVRV